MIFNICVMLMFGVVAQKKTNDDFYSLYTLQGTKDVNLDEIWNINDSLLLVVGHKHKFNYFYVYELKTFQMVFDTSITATERFDGSLSFTYYMDSSNVIYFPKETFVNSYFKIDLKSGKQSAIPCTETPYGCSVLEKKLFNKITHSTDYRFRYMLEKRKRATLVVVSVAKSYFSEQKKTLNMDAKTLRAYLSNGGR